MSTEQDITINIKLPSEETHSVTIGVTATVKALKEALVEKSGLAVAD